MNWKKIKEFFCPADAGEGKLAPVPEKKLYMIEVLSSHRIRYVVECCEITLENIIAADNTDDLDEFSQEHLGDKIISFYTMEGKEDYLKVFDEDNDYLKEWSEELKLGIINRR